MHRVCEQITDPAHLSELIEYAAAMEGIELDPVQAGLIKRIIEPYLASPFFLRLAGDGRNGRSIVRRTSYCLRASFC